MATKKINWIPRYPPMDFASSRLRTYFIHEEFRKRGISSEIKGQDGDIVIVQKCYDIEMIRKFKDQGSKVIFDSDDNHLLPDISKYTDAIVTDCEARRDWYYEQGMDDLVIIPDPIDYGLERPLWKEPKEKEKTIFAFFGYKVNAKNLEVLNEPLDKLGGLWEFHVIVNASTGFPILLEHPYTFVPWTYETFISELRKCDVAVLPQGNEYKSANKMITAIAAGIPVIGSNIPSYRKIAEATATEAFLCKEPKDWLANLWVTQSAIDRYHYLVRTQEYVWKNYNVSKVADQWLELIDGI